MVHVKAYKGSEIRRFEIDSKATFAELKELVHNLFNILQDDTVIVNYCDRDGDLIRLSSDAELQTALNHLGEEDTWKLQIVVEHKQQPQHHHHIGAPSRGAAGSWWDWDPFHLHGHHAPLHPHHHLAHHAPLHGGGLFDTLLGHSLWDDDPFGGFGQFDLLRQQHQKLQREQQKRAEMARCHAMRQASVDAKRASDEVQAQASGGEVAEKKPKVVYHHFGSWEPKVEKGDNYVVTTYGPVGYKVHYTHDDQEETKTEDDGQAETTTKEDETTKME